MSTVAIGTLAAGAISAATSEAGASKQASAANSARELEYQNQQQALGDVEQEWQGQQANEAPFLNTGQGAMLNLGQLLSTPGQGLLAPYSGGQFTAPTLSQAEQQPGYQFQLQEGELALQNSAAAKGELLDPNAMEAESQFAENAAQTDYQNVYNQALNTYQTNYNVWANQQQNEYSRLAGIAGMGETAAGELGQEGGQYGQTVGNILVGGAQQQAQQINNAAAAEAAGITGAGNALGGAVSNAGTDLALGDLMNEQSLYAQYNPSLWVPGGSMPGGGGGSSYAPPVNPFGLPPSAFGAPPSYGG
jgi:hypothetical protein